MRLTLYLAGFPDVESILQMTYDMFAHCSQSVIEAWNILRPG